LSASEGRVHSPPKTRERNNAIPTGPGSPGSRGSSFDQRTGIRGVLGPLKHALDALARILIYLSPARDRCCRARMLDTRTGGSELVVAG
jgi:hypothetical protein